MRLRGSLLAVAVLALATGCGKDETPQSASSGSAEQSSAPDKSSQNKSSSKSKSSGKSGLSGETTSSGAATPEIDRAPADVAQAYWEGLRRNDAARFCSAIVLLVDGKPTDIPRKACLDAYGKGNVKKVARGAVQRVAGTEIRGDEATVRLVVQTKRGPKAHPVSLIRTSSGWKVRLKGP